MRPTRAAKRATLNLRIKMEKRGLIDRATEDTLADRTVLTVSPKAYAEFLARLDRRPKPNNRLRRTMKTRAPWS
jgi:uncharacterized protein (DUF1778 family)